LKSTEITQSNTSAQQILSNLVSVNSKYINFFVGNTTQSGLSLDSIGYEGKTFTELTQCEVQELAFVH